MTELTKIEQPADYQNSLVEVIARAASDPTVDIDKMERLLAMHERLSERQGEIAFNQALNAAQMEMRPVSANMTNSQTKSQYASFDKLDKALRPIYTAHGFSLSFDEADSPKQEHVRVVCYVSHVGGFTRTYHRDMPADGKGAKGGDVMTKTHAAGAAGSYGARYLLKGIFNVAVGEDDNDGNGYPISVDQYDTLKKRVSDLQVNEEAFLQVLKVDNLRNLPAAKFDYAMRQLDRKERPNG